MNDHPILVRVGVQADEHSWTHTVEHRFLCMPDAMTLVSLLIDAKQTFATLYEDEQVEIEGAFVDVEYTETEEVTPGTTADVAE